MQCGEDEPSGEQSKPGRYAGEKRRPAGVPEHGNEREAEKEITGRQEHILPVSISDQPIQQLLKRGHQAFSAAAMLRRAQ